jgi:hypothetical protein
MTVELTATLRLKSADLYAAYTALERLRTLEGFALQDAHFSVSDDVSFANIVKIADEDRQAVEAVATLQAMEARAALKEEPPAEVASEVVEAAVKPMSDEELRAAVQAKLQAKPEVRADVNALIRSYDAPQLSKVAAERRPEFVAAVEAL